MDETASAAATPPPKPAERGDAEYDNIFDIINFSAQGASRQYLTFNLGEERYGLEILKVQEIIGLTEFTPLPNMPPHVRGVINLRGTVVPVVDLRSRFAMEPRPYDKLTSIIVTNVAGKTLGIVVDTVADVMGIPEDAIQDTPSFAASQKISSDYIQAIGKVGNTMVILLDIEKVLDIGDLTGMGV
ncbi:MAG: purine-binding chemotaxis protein CheW [Nitrospirae bacterium]|nr:MAG: purine-binding chemotaxis protein CheW [Nitrospirota bacterium]